MTVAEFSRIRYNRYATTNKEKTNMKSKKSKKLPKLPRFVASKKMVSVKFTDKKTKSRSRKSLNKLVAEL